MIGMAKRCPRPVSSDLARAMAAVESVEIGYCWPLSFLPKWNLPSVHPSTGRIGVCILPFRPCHLGGGGPSSCHHRHAALTFPSSNLGPPVQMVFSLSSHSMAVLAASFFSSTSISPGKYWHLPTSSPQALFGFWIWGGKVADPPP